MFLVRQHMAMTLHMNTQEGFVGQQGEITCMNNQVKLNEIVGKYLERIANSFHFHHLNIPMILFLL